MAKQKIDRKRYISRRALVRALKSHRKLEQKALANDDPKSTCAAWHRGAISQCESLLEKYAPAAKAKRRG